MIVYEGIREGDEATLFSSKRRYGLLNVIIAVNPRRDRLDPQRLCGRLKRAQVIQAASGRGVRVEDGGRALDFEALPS